jgi:hypothetical protein
MAVLENITISCFLLRIGKMEELPPGFEGGFGIFEVGSEAELYNLFIKILKYKKLSRVRVLF